MVGEDAKIPRGFGRRFRCINLIQDEKGPCDSDCNEKNLHCPYEVDGDEYIRGNPGSSQRWESGKLELQAVASGDVPQVIGKVTA